MLVNNTIVENQVCIVGHHHESDAAVVSKQGGLWHCWTGLNALPECLEKIETGMRSEGGVRRSRQSRSILFESRQDCLACLVGEDRKPGATSGLVGGFYLGCYPPGLNRTLP